MASNNNNCINSGVENKRNNEEDLIDLDKVLPEKVDSSWLLECKGNSYDIQDSFSKLHFSNPMIKKLVSSVYRSGKSKQVLHQLLYWNEKLTVSCDNCSYLCSDYNTNIIDNTDLNTIKRHSMFTIGKSNNSLTDSIDSLTMVDNSAPLTDDNGNEFAATHRITQSSDKVFRSPTASVATPTIKNVSTSPNILSRTYDKNDLDILKRTEISQSIVGLHLNEVQTDTCKGIQNMSSATLVNQRHSFVKNTNETLADRNYFKRQFPIATKLRTPTVVNRLAQPISKYQIDKPNKDVINRCLEINDFHKNNVKSKRSLQLNEKIFESDVLTPINSPQKIRPLIETSKLSGLRRSYTCHK